MTTPITAFKVAVPAEELEDLRRRLAATRWPDSQTCEGWDQGMPLAYTRELARYWLEDYDWARFETKLNAWPQFLTAIDGMDIHFIHRRSPHEHALPLIISHGWPDSVAGLQKVIDALADPTAHGGDARDAFHVVIPSLPGFGFSGKPATSGTTVEKIGATWGKLMARLGYQRYVAQGGDWGSMITHSMGLTEAGHCAGIHVNLPIVKPDPDTMNALTAYERSALEAIDFYRDWDSGYSKIQSTRPQTLAYGLADSPVGQMAWIVEKFYSWTDCERDGISHPENVMSRDELLDNVMLYWLNNTAGSSARLYWESFGKAGFDPINIPVGCSMFPKEIFRASRRWAEKRYSKLVYWNELERGGHFPALELPATFVAEIRNCFRLLR